MASYVSATTNTTSTAAAAKAKADAAAAKKAEAAKKLAATQSKQQADAVAKAQAATAAANAAQKPPSEPKDYKWNLPPHKWSLPVKPSEVYPKTFKSNLISNVTDQYRRGRMWWYFNTNNTYTEVKDGKEVVKVQSNGAERRYGFQFPWNPEAFTTSVSLNTEVTPSPADRFASVAGAFPSGETISFTLRLDRTNDFACFRHLLKPNYSLSLKEPATSQAVFEDMAQYYKGGFSDSVGKAAMGKKIQTLMELGTLADIEYLYTAINGPGWTSVSGRATGDIGYLSATLLRIDIGPLSYVGYVNSLSVNHIGFSEDMTPIRTDVQVSVNLMASAGIAADGIPAAVATDSSGKPTT